ncbi:HNH endonuclease, partial [Geodermatophilus sp. SYSU D00696]
MADCLLDLVLRPGESGLPPVQVTLTVVAPVGALLGGDQPCEVDGQVVPAELVRALLAALTGQRADASDTDTAAADTTAADGEATDTTAADAESAQAASEGAEASNPEAASGGGDFLGWEARQQAELEAWWAQMERRVLAGEFDPDPDDTVPDAVLLRWLDQDGPPPEESPPDQAPPPDAPADKRPSAHRGDPGDGWWARADRAVDHASTALLGLERALGHARRTVATAQRADDADEAAWAAGPAGRVTAASDVLTQLAAATDTARADLAALLAATAGGGLTDRPRIALTDAAGGALLALTDLPALHRAARTGTGLGAPAAAAGYRPSVALDRHVR